MADATIDVRRGGRLRIHITNLSASNNTFNILSGMRIEYAYLVNTGTIWNDSLDIKIGGTTSILSVSPIPFSFSSVNDTYELSPFINIDFFSITTDTSLTVSLTNPSNLANIKLILGLETIL